MRRWEEELRPLTCWTWRRLGARPGAWTCWPATSETLPGIHCNLPGLLRDPAPTSATRLGDFDLEDSMSVQSGVTTRSDPDHMHLQRLELSGRRLLDYDIQTFLPGEGASSGGSFHPVQKNRAAVEQWAKSSGQSSGQRRSDNTGLLLFILHSILRDCPLNKGFLIRLPLIYPLKSQKTLIFQ